MPTIRRTSTPSLNRKTATLGARTTPTKAKTSPLSASAGTDPVARIAPRKGYLEQLREAEAALAQVRDSDPQAKWKLARLRAKATMADSNDTEYWAAICFESREQKETFLSALGLLRADEDKFYSGREVAAAIGLSLTPDGRAYHTLPVNPRWRRFAMQPRR